MRKLPLARSPLFSNMVTVLNTDSLWLNAPGLPRNPEPSFNYPVESIIMLNPNEVDAEVQIVLHWTDRAPTALPKVTVRAGCVACERCMEPDGILGVRVEPGEQYAIALHASVPIVAQYGRLDMRSGPMAFYTTPGYCE